MRNKLVAALLAFFLGPVGIHKFYLGENIAGIFYILFSWTFIPAIIAFFEGIGLLLTSDQVFNAKYNSGIAYTFSATESVQDKAAALSEMKRLYDTGVITAGEYEEKRKKLLNSI